MTLLWVTLIICSSDNSNYILCLSSQLELSRSNFEEQYKPGYDVYFASMTLLDFWTTFFNRYPVCYLYNALYSNENEILCTYAQIIIVDPIQLGEKYSNFTRVCCNFARICCGVSSLVEKVLGCGSCHIQSEGALSL